MVGRQVPLVLLNCKEAVKSQPCCKRNDNSISVTFCILLVTIVGQMVKPLPQWAHLCWVPEQATIKEGMKTFQRKI